MKQNLAGVLPGSGGPGRIVAIDDDPDVLLLLQTALKGLGSEVETFERAQEAIASIRAAPPRLVLTDLNMPGMGGRDVIAALVRPDGTRTFPIVVLSARGEEETILECFALGAADYLVKPILPTELRAKCSILLARFQAQGPRAAPRSTATAEFLGRPLAGYLVRREIGRGGMGVVYEAESPTGERVALKLLDAGLSLDTSLLRRFFREAENLKRVQHANVCGFRGIGHDAGRYVLIMEYVDGLPLDHVLEERGPWSEAAAVDLMIQVARALCALHDLGIVHRDIKASNVLLDASGQVKLVDFGLTKHSEDEDLTATQILMGTPSYMSPEQARGDQTIDIRADLYSVGVLYYVLVTGRRPFEGTNFAVLLAHANDPAPDPRTIGPGISAETVAIIQRLMAKCPEDRYPAPADLLRALEIHRAWLRVARPQASQLRPADPTPASAETAPARERRL